MAVAKDNISLVRMSQMPVGLSRIVIDVIPFLQHRIVGGGGRLPCVYLRGIGEHRGFRWPADPADASRRLVHGRGQIQVVAVAVGGAGGFALEMLHRVIQRWTNFHAASTEVRIERAGGWIERPCPFAAARQPSEPVQIAAVGGGSTILKGMAAVIVPVELRRQAKLPQVANAFDSLR